MGVLESTQRDKVKRLVDFPDSEVESAGKAMGDLELNTRQEATERGCSSVDFNPEKTVKISNTYGTEKLSNSSTRAQDSSDRVRKYEKVKSDTAVANLSSMEHICSKDMVSALDTKPRLLVITNTRASIQQHVL